VPVEVARRRRGLVLFGGAWMLPQEAEAAAKAQAPAAPKDGSLVGAMRTAATATEPALAVAAKLRVRQADGKARAEAATALLLDADPVVRTWSSAELAGLGDESALRPLILSAVRDRDPDVRRAAVKAVASFGNDDAIVPFLRALDSTHPGLVVNAAHALAGLGDRRAVGYVVKKLWAHGGSGRSVVEFLNKVSYVGDYDVEIAQAANIANPIVKHAVDGVVLDIRILDTSIEKTIVETVLVDTVNSLAGTSFRDGAQVAAWWSENAGSFPGLVRKPDSARRATVTPPR
jgi:hypothetical protein